MSETFRVEQAYYNRRLKSWLRAGHGGKWTVIKSETDHGFYPSFEEAKKAAVKMKIKPPALIRKIGATSKEREEYPVAILGGITPGRKRKQ
jgi:hypothetical protein